MDFKKILKRHAFYKHVPHGSHMTPEIFTNGCCGCGDEITYPWGKPSVCRQCFEKTVKNDLKKWPDLYWVTK